MIRFTVGQKAERAALIERLDEALGDADRAVQTYNDALDALPTPSDELEAVNEAIEAWNTWAEAVGDTAADWFDAASEAWQTSPEGEAFRRWVASLEGACLDEIEAVVDSPDHLYAEYCDVDLPELPNPPEAE